MSIKSYNWPLILSILIFVISLPLDAYFVHQLKNLVPTDGFTCLLIGWIGLLGLGSAIAWLANPLLILSWAFSKSKPKRAFYFSVAALGLALSFLLFDQAMINEAGYNKIASVSYGYYCWVLSISIMVIATSYQSFFKA